MHCINFTPQSLTLSCFITVPFPLEVVPQTLFTGIPNIVFLINMPSNKRFADFIFQTGEIANTSCDRCKVLGSLCIVSSFSTCCGLCLRSASYCTFLDVATPLSLDSVSPFVHRDVELRNELSRAVSVIQHISKELNSSALPVGRSSFQSLELSLDKRGWLTPPKCCPLNRNLTT